MQGVRIHNKSLVEVPSSGEKIPLSFLDARWIHLQQPVQEILLYPNSTLSSSSLDSFKSSLALAVSLFHPLAGKLTYQPSTDQLIVDCLSVGNGVFVTEAESDLNIHQLASEEVYDVESYMKLVPHISMEKLPVAVFAVQITRFVGGGVSVGTALNHCAMDGIGFWRFMETWAKICLNDSTGFPFGLDTNHDRSVILHLEKEEVARQFLRQLAPDLPQEYT
ncbi:hypothetical protein LUZ60_014438 [Juncus effusus]|nr:hypothetical protein LUZ60_014438 [Juncus effusus]